MRKYIAVAAGTVGFFIMAGAGGGLECDTMGWGQALAWMGLGLVMMFGSVLYARRAR